MNIIFLTLARISDVEERGFYQDLMRKFRDEGHQVYIVTAAERRLGQETSLVKSSGVAILNVKTLNIQKTNIVEKGIGTLLIESQYKDAIKKYMGDVKFDLILYTTPPITFPEVIAYLKLQNPQAMVRVHFSAWGGRMSGISLLKTQKTVSNGKRNHSKLCLCS